MTLYCCSIRIGGDIRNPTLSNSADENSTHANRSVYFGIVTDSSTAFYQMTSFYRVYEVM